MINLEKLWVYDIETYLNLFSFSIVRADGKYKKTFSCSRYGNQFDRIINCIDYLSNNNCHMVGFNNIGFDYPVIHELYNLSSQSPKTGLAVARKMFRVAQDQINSFKGEGFGNTVKTDDEIVSQIDLFKIHHFDNKARSTSLKMIEFNLRMNNIKDLPYDIEDELNEKKVEEILEYNEHDVEATRLFLLQSLPQIEFRMQLTEKYNKNFLNHNDGKIGKDYFKMKLEEEGVSLYKYKNGKLILNQTKRETIDLGECLFNYYDFERPEFIAVKEWFSKQKIKETKGVFSDIPEHILGDVAQYAEMIVKRIKLKSKDDPELKKLKKDFPLGWIEEEELKAMENVLDENGNVVKIQNERGRWVNKKQPKKSYRYCYNYATCLNVVIDGFRFDFGVGGIHGSISSKVARSNDVYDIVDADVASMYPNIAISNKVYPEHLGEGFCKIYEDVYNQRKSYSKGTPENAMLKLALNSVYGDSNSEYSVFYDPKYTMTITINGQLSLCLLSEKLMKIKGLKLIQVNTDGVTVALKKQSRQEYMNICKQWEKQVKLDLEYVDYSAMYIRDVNNYIATYANGGVKRKGAYQYEELAWHQNQSALVVSMAAEAKMLNGVDLKKFVTEHWNKGNYFDFMLRTKVDKSSRLVLNYEDGEDIPQQRICRYYPAVHGGKLVKIMKPLEGKTEERRIGFDTQYLVKTCNDMSELDDDINIDYYVEQAEKLLIE